MSNRATPTSSVPAFAVGSTVAGYRLEEQIGRGGMAVVFRALDERLNRHVALKILGSSRVDKAFRQRFVRESQAAAAVDDPHIIPVYEAGEADGVLFIAMRLVQGGDLRTLVARSGPLSPARTGWIVSCVASALDAAHARGLVHRDVKPANMLLDVRPGRPDHVYLSDFGVSKAALETGGVTDSGQFLGTVDYAAPEQIQGHGVDGRTDQYALGCAAYELLCGRAPFSGKELLAVVYAHVSQPPPALSSIRDGLPAAVDAVFARVLAKSAADRYGTCEEFASELRSALGLPPYADRLAGQAAGPDAGDDTLDPAAARVQAARIRAAAAAGWSDPGSTMQMPAGAPVAQPPGLEMATRGPRRHLGAADGLRWRRVLAGALAAVVVGGGAAAFALTHGRAPAAAVPVQFRQSYAGGLAVTQLWRFSGSGGTQLDVTIWARNAAGRRVAVQLKEPIPAAVAGSLKDVKFAGGHSPRAPIAGSRVFVWDLNLSAKGSAEVRYQVAEPAKGATAARLGAFVGAFMKVAKLQNLELVPAGQLKYMVIIPSEVSLQPGGTDQLVLRGTRSNATGARPRDLSGAVWSSSNPAVASVTSSGFVVGKAPGATVVTARVGSLTASAIVTVLAARSGEPAAPYSPVPGQSSPGSTPTSSPPTSSSPPPSSSPPTSSSPPPSSSPPTSSSPPPSSSPPTSMPSVATQSAGS